MICLVCQAANEADATFCISCGRSLSSARPPASSFGVKSSTVYENQAVISPNSVIPANDESSDLKSMRTRYKNAYQVAKTIVGVGETIKVIGILLAIIILLLSFGVMTQASNMGSYAIFLGLPGIASGIIVGILLYLLGVLVTAQGQILKANLDTAVNTSPFLTNEVRMEIMSLR